jgi:hypothetical protein
MSIFSLTCSGVHLANADEQIRDPTEYLLEQDDSWHELMAILVSIVCVRERHVHRVSSMFMQLALLPYKIYGHATCTCTRVESRHSTAQHISPQGK